MDDRRDFVRCELAISLPSFDWKLPKDLPASVSDYFEYFFAHNTTAALMAAVN